MCGTWERNQSRVDLIWLGAMNLAAPTIATLFKTKTSHQLQTNRKQSIYVQFSHTHTHVIYIIYWRMLFDIIRVNEFNLGCVSCITELWKTQSTTRYYLWTGRPDRSMLLFKEFGTPIVWDYTFIISINVFYMVEMKIILLNGKPVGIRIPAQIIIIINLLPSCFDVISFNHQTHNTLSDFRCMGKLYYYI